MADILDKADEVNELFLEAALRSKKPEGPTYTGFCHNCQEPLPFPDRWCDKDCNADWSARENKGLGPIDG